MPEPLSFLGGADDPSAAFRERTRRFPGGAELTLDLAHREWVGLRAKGFLHPLASKQASKKEINQARNNKTKAAALQGPIHLLSHPLTKPKTGEPTAWAQGLGEREREREKGKESAIEKQHLQQGGTGIKITSNSVRLPNQLGAGST